LKDLIALVLHYVPRFRGNETKNKSEHNYEFRQPRNIASCGNKLLIFLIFLYFVDAIITKKILSRQGISPIG